MQRDRPFLNFRDLQPPPEPSPKATAAKAVPAKSPAAKMPAATLGAGSSKLSPPPSHRSGAHGLSTPAKLQAKSSAGSGSTAKSPVQSSSSKKRSSRVQPSPAPLPPPANAVAGSRRSVRLELPRLDHLGPHGSWAPWAHGRSRAEPRGARSARRAGEIDLDETGGRGSLGPRLAWGTRGPPAPREAARAAAPRGGGGRRACDFIYYI